MIKSFLTIVFLIHSSCFADKCIFDDESWCVFTSVNTTEAKPLFNPTATNPVLVKKVKFAKSSMHTFTSEICNAFPNLKELEVDQVGLEKIAPEALLNCSKLTDISFWTNDLSEVPVDIFKNNSLLETLTFQHNYLKNINPIIFQNLTKLKTLALNENYLVEFPVYKMPRLLNLVTIWIHHNDLTDLDEQEILYKFPNLKTIYMEDNPFNCDRLKVMLAAFQRKKITIDRWHDSPRDRKYTLTTVDSVDCLSDEEKEKYLSKDRMTDLKDQVDEIAEDIGRINNLKTELNKTLNEISEKSASLTEKISKWETEVQTKNISSAIEMIEKLRKEVLETSENQNDENYQRAMKAIHDLDNEVKILKNSGSSIWLLLLLFVLTISGGVVILWLYRRNRGLAGFKFHQTRDDVEFSTSTTNIFVNS